jgi:hypothetical protein
MSRFFKNITAFFISAMIGCFATIAEARSYNDSPKAPKASIALSAPLPAAPKKVIAKLPKIEMEKGYTRTTQYHPENNKVADVNTVYLDKRGKPNGNSEYQLYSQYGILLETSNFYKDGGYNIKKFDAQGRLAYHSSTKDNILTAVAFDEDGSKRSTTTHTLLNGEWDKDYTVHFRADAAEVEIFSTRAAPMLEAHFKKTASTQSAPIIRQLPDAVQDLTIGDKLIIFNTFAITQHTDKDAKTNGAVIAESGEIIANFNCSDSTCTTIGDTIEFKDKTAAIKFFGIAEANPFGVFSDTLKWHVKTVPDGVPISLSRTENGKWFYTDDELPTERANKPAPTIVPDPVEPQVATGITKLGKVGK